MLSGCGLAGIFDDDVRVGQSRFNHPEFAISPLAAQFGKLVLTHFDGADRRFHSSLWTKLPIPVFDGEFHLRSRFCRLLHLADKGVRFVSCHWSSGWRYGLLGGLHWSVGIDFLYLGIPVRQFILALFLRDCLRSRFGRCVGGHPFLHGPGGWYLLGRLCLFGA